MTDPICVGIIGTGRIAVDGHIAAIREAMSEVARAAGTALTVEPHIGSLIDKPEMAMKMVRKVRYLHYILDYSHFYAQGIPIEEVYPLHPWSLHIHAKQAAVGRPKTLWHDGTIPFRDIVQQLDRDGWEGVISPEYIGTVPADPDPEPLQLLSNPVLQNSAGLYALAQELCALRR